jgi:hypothetical protein
MSGACWCRRPRQRHSQRTSQPLRQCRTSRLTISKSTSSCRHSAAAALRWLAHYRTVTLQVAASLSRSVHINSQQKRRNCFISLSAAPSVGYAAVARAEAACSWPSNLTMKQLPHSCSSGRRCYLGGNAGGDDMYDLAILMRCIIGNEMPLHTEGTPVACCGRDVSVKQLAYAAMSVIAVWLAVDGANIWHLPGAALRVRVTYQP